MMLGNQMKTNENIPEPQTILGHCCRLTRFDRKSSHQHWKDNRV